MDLQLEFTSTLVLLKTFIFLMKLRPLFHGKIQALSSSVSRSRMVWEFRQRLNFLGRSNNMTLLWVPGRIGVAGNEKSDELVRKGASTP